MVTTTLDYGAKGPGFKSRRSQIFFYFHLYFKIILGQILKMVEQVHVSFTLTLWLKVFIPWAEAAVGGAMLDRNVLRNEI